MAVRWAIASGNFSSTATWNDGGVLGIPTTGDDVYTNSFTVAMDTNATVNSLNNSARARTIATPQMTANNVPSPYVAAASNADGSFPPFRAFDRTISYGVNQWQTVAPTTNAWLSYDFGSGNSVVIDGYTIFASDNTSFAPFTWQLQGSDNNSTWTTLHSVTSTPIPNSGTYSIASIGNPIGYRYYRLNVTAVNGGNIIRVTELELYQPGTSALAAGGSFNFNTAGVTVSATSTSAALSAGATNLITVTATTGTVTLSLGSAVTGLAIGFTQIFNYTGNCNFTLNGVRFTGGSSSNPNTFCINKSSTGTITITGDLVGGTTVNGNNSLNSTAGNTVVIGSIFGSANSIGISQSAGNITVTGNVTGGTGGSIHGISLTGAASQFTINGDVRGGSGGSAHGISFGGTLGTVNGNVTGGSSTGRGISADTAGVNVTGNVIGNVGIGLAIGASSTIIGNVFGGGVGAGITTATNNSFTVTVTGDVYASTTQAGISLTGTGTQVVNLTGNMYNTLGRSAIWCPNVFISNTATTLWRMDTGGGNYKFLYSADSTPNLPATTNVRNGVTFGPALSLTGTMVVPSSSDVRENVPVDNTVGTGELTSADIISGINASSNDLAVRLKNTLTDTTAGNIISQYNNS
jgi:hypothetical protein